MSQAEALRVADEVWIATALLHREHPDRDDFTVQEISRRAQQETAQPALRPGFTTHAYIHCVANRPPQPTGYRMLYATGPNTRRLYRPGDPTDARRRGKTTPRREQIPERYHELLEWYRKDFAGAGSPKGPSVDPVLELYGLGKEIWEGVDPDDYVRELREGWE